MPKVKIGMDKQIKKKVFNTDLDLIKIGNAVLMSTGLTMKNHKKRKIFVKKNDVKI